MPASRAWNDLTRSSLGVPVRWTLRNVLRRTGGPPSIICAVTPRPPDAVAPPPGNPRFPLLDPLRAVAALCIVVTHTAAYSHFNSLNPLGAWTARLDCGVAIFFVLSGFLLYRPFVAARLGGRPGPSVGRYARRRLLRIIPAYWVA